MKASSIPVSGLPLHNLGAVEQQLRVAHQRFSAARNKEEFAGVGRACAEVFFLLLQAVYAQDRRALDELKHPLTESPFQLLDAYLALKLAGPAKEPARSALSLAESTSHEGIKDKGNAGNCLTATDSVVRYLVNAVGKYESHETISDLCERYAQTIELGTTHGYAVRMLAKMPIGEKIASQLTPDDIIEHCRRRRERVAGPTVSQDITYLRGVLLAASDLGVGPEAVEQAKPTLEKLGLIGKSIPRTRRPTREELANLVAYFEKQDKHWRSKIPMRVIMEFALWSARRISEICNLKWEDLDEKAHTCISRGVKGPRDKVGRNQKFPLLGKAWDIVQRQPKGSDRIFPYNAKSASGRYTLAKKHLGIENLRFNDLRREAAIRLYEAGHSVEQIAEVTGRMDLNSLLRDISPKSHAGVNSEGANANPRAPVVHAS